MQANDKKMQLPRTWNKNGRINTTICQYFVVPRRFFPPSTSVMMSSAIGHMSLRNASGTCTCRQTGSYCSCSLYPWQPRTALKTNGQFVGNKGNSGENVNLFWDGGAIGIAVCFAFLPAQSTCLTGINTNIKISDFVRRGA